MPIERQHLRQLTYSQIQGLILLAVAPWLLFPFLAPVATTLALVAVAILLLLPWLTRRQALYFTPFNGAILLLEIGILVGIAVTADPDQTLPKATGLILGLAVWRYLAQTAGEDYSRLRKATVVFLVVCLGFVVLGAVSADWQLKVPYLATLLNHLPAQLVRLPEAPEPGVSTNQLAGVILFCLPLAISLAFGWRPAHRSRMVLTGLSALIVLLGILLILTQSRSGWIGGLAGIASLLLMWGLILPPSKRRTLVRLSLMMLLVIGLLTIIWIGPEQLRQVWEEPAGVTPLGRFSTVTFRLEVWRWALVTVSDFPFSGTGLGTFRLVAQRLYPIAVPPTFDIAHAHNIFLQVALDTGLPGLIAYTSIVAIAFVVGWRVARRNPKLRPLAIGLLSVLVAFHVFSLADALAPGSKPGILFWMSLGLLSAMDRLSRQNQAVRDTVNEVGEQASEGS